ncbi:hypothetical protein GQ457_15G017320 [Hibiscus cannabinus]
MPTCYASYHHRTTSHRLITHPTKSNSISRLTQHFAKAKTTAHSGSPRPIYSGGLSRDIDVISMEIKDSSASCNQEIKVVDFSG